MKSTDRKDPHYVFSLLSCHFLSLHLSCSVCVLSRVLGHVLQVTRSYLAYYGLCVQTWTSCNAVSQEFWRITVSVMVGLSINYVNRIVIIWSVLLFMSVGRDYVSELRPPTGLLFIPQVIYEYGEPRCNAINRENRKISEKIATLNISFTTNRIWRDPGANPGLYSDRPATNRVSHAMTISTVRGVCKKLLCWLYC
jgi:hypothetical protein